MSVQIQLATAADDAAIRGLLRREPVPGRIAISYEREPEFAIGCDATGENPTVLVARHVESGETVGVACRSEREVYVNGKPVRLGYLGQLRVDRRYRGRWLVSRGYSVLKSLHDRDPLPAYLAAVTAENREAEGILVERPRRMFPAFHAVGEYCTFALRVRRGPAVQMATANGTEVAQFLQAHGSRRQFFPVWTESKLMALGRLGLQFEDIRVVRRGGAIAGVMAVWDQSAYKQNVVRAYSGWMRVAAALSRRLPRVGEEIRSAYAALVCVADDDVTVFRELVAGVMHAAAERGLEYLLLGLDVRDPLEPAARMFPHVLYRSRLFLAEWPEGGHLHDRLDGRPSYVEIASL
jgi:hypothetical protein